METFFRGRKPTGLTCISSVTYKPDFQLLSKKEEAEFCKEVQVEEKLIGRTMELPPLLKEFIVKETGQKEPKMRVILKDAKNKSYRLAKEGETPNVQPVIGVGIPHPTGVSLYEGLNLK